MNKKMLLIPAALIVAGSIALTAFGGKTKAEQEAEINQAAQEQLEMFREEQKQACTDRVMAEAQVRYDQFVAEQAAAKPTTTKKTGKKTTGPRVDPIPATAPPAKSDKQSKMTGESTTEEKKAKMAPTEQAPAPTTDKKKSKMSGGN